MTEAHLHLDILRVQRPQIDVGIDGQLIADLRFLQHTFGIHVFHVHLRPRLAHPFNPARGGTGHLAVLRE